MQLKDKEILNWMVKYMLDNGYSLVKAINELHWDLTTSEMQIVQTAYDETKHLSFDQVSDITQYAQDSNVSINQAITNLGFVATKTDISYIVYQYNDNISYDINTVLNKGISANDKKAKVIELANKYITD